MRAMRALGLAIGWALVATIIWLSVTTRPIELGVAHGDKLGHLAAYGSAMFWFCQLYRQRATRSAYAAGFIAMGIALEFVQLGLGYRTFEVADMVADAVGVALGWLVALPVARLLK
jgi:VanZ family protein